MNFLEFHRHEIDAATYVSPYEKWAAAAEKMLGHSLDGDQSEDGYSLDWALEEFNAGVTVDQFVDRVNASRTKFGPKSIEVILAAHQVTLERSNPSGYYLHLDGKLFCTVDGRKLKHLFELVETRATCRSCGSQYDPSMGSCGCFDNNCQ